MKKTILFLFLMFLTPFAFAQIIDIPDANFKNALVNTNCARLTGNLTVLTDVDTNDDGEIQVSEAEAVATLIVSNQNIASLESIEAFINLVNLDTKNNQLTALNINTLNKLTWLRLDDNLFTGTDNIIFPTNSINDSFTLHIVNNQLTTINNLPSNLSNLACNENQLTSLDLTAFELSELFCSNNPNLTSLELNPYSGNLHINNIGITELDLSGFNISELSCRNNSNLTFVQLGNGVSQGSYSIEDNPVLESISFKNGVNNYYGIGYSGYYSICDNPSLSFVCADENEIENWTYGEVSTITVYGVQQIVDNCGYTNVAVNSYCSFTPGGEFYTIEGKIKIDLDNNGCDNMDSTLPHIIFQVTNGTETGNFISNATENYSIPIGEGTHIITPTFENPSYFAITPSSLEVNFPTDTSPYLQDFCITPNGSYNDLEITLIPIEAARPGFDANYKIVYKNKGTTMLSGSVDLIFQDEFMDLVSASPTEDAQSTGLLTWDFTDLTPFESREIDFTMNINSPMDSPPVNGDDILEFTTILNTSETDETLDDNTFTLNQTVVNSFDPNDKTCLEGDFITPEMVGEYVHYMIRFENTGTANAVNIVVKDNIDITTYDLSSIIPLYASHDYFAKIKDNDTYNYVEFIFENINLPFDDANNDGYIVFKIKTLETLAINDTFENEAEIYFDFNFPIITNTEQTTVATLSTDEFELAKNTVSLYPNPTTQHLTLESKQAIKQILIFDISGRSIIEIAVIGTKTDITISTEELSKGTYFVKIKTNTSEIVKKVIKM